MKTTQRIVRSVAATLLVSIGSSAAYAEQVQFQFSATVTYSNLFVDGAKVDVGSKVEGLFAFDTAKPASYAYEGYARYQIALPLMASVNGHAISSPRIGVDVFDNMGGNVEDMIRISGLQPTVAGQYLDQGTFSMVFASGPGQVDALLGTQLPKSLDLAKFDAGGSLTYGVLQSNGGPNGRLLTFTVDSLSAVPEPSALSLVLVGALGVAGFARRKTTA